MSWQQSYARRLLYTDLVVILASVFGSQFLWFGTRAVDLASRVNLGVSYTSVSIALAVVWLSVLGAYGTRDLQLVGNGTLEYKRVLDSTVRVFVVFAIVAFLFGIGHPRGYFLTALPVGLIAMLHARW
ncbi:MAG: sugar transferase, partial [Candidatus Saccharibacteria bacterium]|nr:sugar transferase [Microbacteriaceae bacterium]